MFKTQVMNFLSIGFFTVILLDFKKQLYKLFSWTIERCQQLELFPLIVLISYL